MVEGDARSYRYLLRLLPTVGEDSAAEPDPAVDGWERVSQRLTDDGSDLVVVYRRPA